MKSKKEDKRKKKEKSLKKKSSMIHLSSNLFYWSSAQPFTFTCIYPRSKLDNEHCP